MVASSTVLLLNISAEATPSDPCLGSMPAPAPAHGVAFASIPTHDRTPTVPHRGAPFHVTPVGCGLAGLPIHDFPPSFHSLAPGARLVRGTYSTPLKTQARELKAGGTHARARAPEGKGAARRMIVSPVSSHVSFMESQASPSVAPPTPTPVVVRCCHITVTKRGGRAPPFLGVVPCAEAGAPGRAVRRSGMHNTDMA